MPVDERAGEPQDFVQSVGRALRVLEVVSAHPGLQVKAIARRTGLNLSTTYHLARTLAYEGYLERQPDGSYVTGAQLTYRFYDVLASLGRPPSAHEVLRHLAAHTGLSAYLGRLTADQVVVVDYVEGPGSPYLEDFERGLNVSAHATALGKALMLGLDRHHRDTFLRAQGMQPFTEHTITDVERLDFELSLLDTADVVLEHGEFRDDVSCAAHLVPTADPGPASWAVVVSCHGHDVPARARHELAHAARDLAASDGPAG